VLTTSRFKCTQLFRTGPSISRDTYLRQLIKLIINIATKPSSDVCFSIHISTCTSVCLFVCPHGLPIHLFIYLCPTSLLHIFVCPPCGCLSSSPSFFRLFVCPSVSLSVHFSICPSVFLFDSLFVVLAEIFVKKNFFVLNSFQRIFFFCFLSRPSPTLSISLFSNFSGTGWTQTFDHGMRRQLFYY
jgi:hypothetical protein